jgi:hypothetical protein
VPLGVSTSPNKNLSQTALRWQESPFHSASPFRQFAQAAHQADNKPAQITDNVTISSVSQKLIKSIVRYSPLISLAGGGLLLLTATKPLLSKTPHLLSLVQKMEKSRLGIHLTALSFLTGALTDVVGGLHLKQPAMIAAGGLQMIPPLLLSFYKGKSAQTLATHLWMLLCGLWQVGYVKTLDKSHSGSQDSVTNLQEGLNLKKIGDDHVHLVKSLFSPNSNPNSNTASQLARTSVLLTYLGTLPAIGMSLLKRTPSPVLNKLLTHTRILALITANVSLFQVALKQQSLLGKAPLLGIPMSAIGNATATSPLLLGLGRIGEALNTGFFSNLALNGLTSNATQK